MIRIQQKIHDGLNVLQYFTLREWRFENTKLLELRSQMTKTDEEKFTLAMEKIDPEPYMVDSILGARHYCLKEDPASIPRCRRNIKILYVIDKMAQGFFYFLLGWFLLNAFQFFMRIVDTNNQSTNTVSSTS